MSFEPIAIVGRSCILPGALSPDQLWSAVRDGRDLLSGPPAGHWRIDPQLVLTSVEDHHSDATWSDRGGFVRGFSAIFDPTGFALEAESIRALDPLFHWALHGVREALRDGGFEPIAAAQRCALGDRCGVILGNLSYPTQGLSQLAEAIWLDSQDQLAGARARELAGVEHPDPRNRFSSGLPALLAARGLRLGGPTFALDAACASSLYAIALACDALHEHRADLMVAGGLNRADDLFIHIGFCALQALSRSGRSRPFHRDADGLVPAEGAAFVALRRLDDARRAGDPILGVIRSAGLCNDGRGRGLLAPASEGQARAMRLAYARSGLSPRDISLVECHATGTTVGDATELRSMQEVFAGSDDLPIGSLKSNLGHLITASGAAGLIKVLAAMHAGVRPPTLHAEQPLELLAGSHLRPLQEAEPWTCAGVRRAAVSNFGFGGNNAHLLVEQYAPATSSVALPAGGALRSGAPAARSDAAARADAGAPPEIAIAGVEVIAADGSGTADFARALFAGDSRVRDQPGGGRGAFAASVELPLTGIRFPPSDLDQTLAQQLSILRATHQLLERAGDLPRERTGVLVGMECDAEVARYGARWRVAQWAQQWARAEGVELSSQWLATARERIGSRRGAAGVVGAMPNIPANRLSSQFDLVGPSFTLSAEQLSSVVALQLAALALQRGELDAVIVGGVDLCCEPVHRAAASAVLAEHERIPGDAAVAILLQRSEDARRAGRPIHATIAEIAIGAERPAPAQIGSEPEPESAPGPVLQASQLCPLFGHAHAASGLLAVAAGALSCHHRAWPPLAPAAHALPLLGDSPAPTTGETDRPRPDRATVELTVTAEDLTGRQARAVLRSGDRAPAPLLLRAERMFVYSGEDRTGALRALARGEQSDSGPARLVLVARDEKERAALAERAPTLLAAGGDEEIAARQGIYLSERFATGEIGFVYTGPAGSYPGMGAELLLAFPELFAAAHERFAGLAEAVGWVFDPRAQDPGAPVGPAAKLWGSSLLSLLHTDVSRDLLGLRPDAALGFCSGETNALFALGAWRDLDRMYRDLEQEKLFSHQIGGDFAVVARAWRTSGALGDEKRVRWRCYRAIAESTAEVERAVRDVPRVRLTIESAPGDVVFAGDEHGCERVAERLGRHRVYPLGYDLAIHCPEIAGYRDRWRQLHHRRTYPVEGVRFYSVASGSAYRPDADAAADALTAMALERVDFPRLIRRAWDDGVRVFVEHGPRSGCTGWIRRILGDRPHVAVALDSSGRSAVSQLVHAAAQLVAAGVPIARDRLETALSRARRETASDYACSPRATTTDPPPPTRSYPAHPQPVAIPPLAPARAAALVDAASPPARPSTPPQPAAQPGARPPAVQPMDPAPTLPPVYSRPAPAYPSARGDVQSAPESGGRGRKNGAALPAPLRGALDAHAAATAAHGAFLEQLARTQRAFSEQRTRALQRLAANARPAVARAPAPSGNAIGVRPRAGVGAGNGAADADAREIGPAPTVAVAPSARPVAEAGRFGSREPIGPRFDRAQLERLASHRISEVLGPLFARQDDFPRQVRLPEPPLLLVDRVAGIDAEPGSMKRGTIWTETDVRWDGWYLDEGVMPAGITVESGQADLLLISYLGADFHNRGQRVYRLLGCELTYHGGLPRPGDTLCYDIHVDGHAKAGDTRLFFFHYDCRVDGEVRLSVRNGQAGFFSDDELAGSGGILWRPETQQLAPDPRIDPPAVRCTRSSFSSAQVRAFSEGRAHDCFGPGFELTRTHTRTPKIQAGRMLLLQRVTDFDPTGGPWGRGYLRVDNELSPDDWTMRGHFKDDPCMPGTLMCEGCLQAMAFYLAALGYTRERDGWRFEPAADQRYELACRGQVTPSSRQLTYEVFVEEVIDGPIPTLYADILGTADGLKIFHGRRMGLQLVPDWPLSSRPELCAASEARDRGCEVAEVDGFRFGYRSLLACAWGKPSNAFGRMGAPFDSTRRIARLPGPPYHFMSRVRKVEGEMGALAVGSAIELDYDIPPDAWYFSENAARVMPFCVLLEAVLQPCGWLAVYTGCPSVSDEDLYFRNLDGSGTVHAELGPRATTLRTHTRLTNISRVKGMILVSFDVEARAEGRPIFSLKTSFGFFPRQALAQQVGLPASDDERAWLDAPAEIEIDLRGRPIADGSSELRLAGPMLSMLDSVGYWPGGGPAGLGRARAHKAVDPADWFFRAHFFQDPVQPGSLGIEAMLQLLQWVMQRQRMDEGIAEPRFEPIGSGEPLSWKYRGQVTPAADRTTIELNVLERGRDERGAYAVAEAWLWADRLRIYHAPRFAMRIVSGRPPVDSDRLEVVDEQALDPARDRWLADHRPNYTLPTLPLSCIADRLAGAAHAYALERWPRPEPVAAGDPRPGDAPWKVVGIEDLRLEGWVSFAGPRRLRTAVLAAEDVPHSPSGRDAPRAVDAALQVWREAATAELSRFETVARARVLLARDYPKPPPPLLPCADGAQQPDPYASGALFHGPAFQLLRDLRIGAAGSTALLDAAAGDVPAGLLGAGLLDGAVHGIPHDELHRWAADLDPELLAYPFALERAAFFGPRPRTSTVRCETRFVGFADEARRFPRFAIQLVVSTADGERVHAELTLREVLVEMGVHGRDRAKRLRFLRDRAFVEGVGLARFCDDATTRLTAEQVARRQWLKGSVAHTYGEPPSADREALVRRCAIKDHIAQRARVHPSTVAIERDEGAWIAARCAAQPMTRYTARIVEGDEVIVRDADPPALELGPLRSYGRRTLGVDRAWPMEVLSLGLCQAFVRRVVVDDPPALDDLRGRPAIFVANHQVQIESLLFPQLTAALVDNHIVTIAKAEHERGWVGQLIRIAESYPGVDQDPAIVYFRQQDRASMFAIIERLRRAMRSDGHGLFVHVEGELGLRARAAVQRISSVFIDLALELDAPLVPVRFAGGLPVEPLAATRDFPHRYGRQDYFIGRPLAAAELRALPYADRRRSVLEAIDAAGDIALDREQPLDGDGALAEAIARWRDRAASEAQAVALAVLERHRESLGPDADTLLERAAGPDQRPDAERDPRSGWLDAFARWLHRG